MAVACTDVRPVVPTGGKSNWNPAGIGPLRRRDDVEVADHSVDHELRPTAS